MIILPVFCIIFLNICPYCCSFPPPAARFKTKQQPVHLCISHQDFSIPREVPAHEALHKSPHPESAAIPYESLLLSGDCLRSDPDRRDPDRLCAVPHNLYSLYLDNGFDLSDFMKKSFDLVIGIELLKMFCRHDLDSIVEVLLFSVARQMVIDHPCPQRSFLSAVLPLRSSSLSAGFSSYPFWIIPMSMKEN